MIEKKCGNSMTDVTNHQKKGRETQAVTNKKEKDRAT